MNWGLWRCSLTSAVSSLLYVALALQKDLRFHLKKKKITLPMTSVQLCKAGGRHAPCPCVFRGLLLSLWLISCHPGNANCPPVRASPTAVTAPMLPIWQIHRKHTGIPLQKPPCFIGLASFHLQRSPSCFWTSKGPFLTQPFIPDEKRNKFTRGIKQGQCWNNLFPLFSWRALVPL